ncbi:hypothetical protein ACDA63_20090, partial [Uliginosibacterium sp. sgz301328]
MVPPLCVTVTSVASRLLLPANTPTFPETSPATFTVVAPVPSFMALMPYGKPEMVPLVCVTVRSVADRLL